MIGADTFPPLVPISLLSLRDLSDMRNELARASHSAQVSCAGLSAALQGREGGAALALEREKALRLQLEQQLRERVAETMTLQTRADSERSELNVRSAASFGSPKGLMLIKAAFFDEY